MRIEIKMIDLIDAKTKKGDAYQQLEVTYKNDRGETKAKKLLPFGDSKPIFEAFTKFKRGDIVDVQTQKNGEYLDWVEVSVASDEPPASKIVKTGPAAAVAVAYPPAKQSWDDADKARQMLIVRQSALKASVDFCRGPDADVDTVLDIAQTFVDFVFEEEVKKPVTSSFADMDDDIPE